MYDEELHDVLMRYTIDDPKLSIILEDDVARAIWMAWRMWHPVSLSEDLALIRTAMSIALFARKNKKLLDQPFPKLMAQLESHIWVEGKFDPDNDFFRFILPYLKGDKIATIRKMEHQLSEKERRKLEQRREGKEAQKLASEVLKTIEKTLDDFDWVEGSPNKEGNE